MPIQRAVLALRSLRSGGNNVARLAVFRIWAGWRRARVSFCSPTHTPLPRGVGCIIAPRPQRRDGAFRRVVSCAGEAAKRAPRRNPQLAAVHARELVLLAAALHLPFF